DVLRGNFNQNHRQDLELFTEQVNDLLYSNQLESYLNQENFENNRFVLYSAGSEKTEIKGMRAKILESLKMVEYNLQQFRNRSDINKSDKTTVNRYIKELNNLKDEESMLVQKQAVVAMLSVASNH